MGRRRLCDLSAAVFFFASVIASASAAASDTISIGQLIEDGETLVSKESLFEMGFFSPGASTNRYLGVWYKKPAKRVVIWVANRNVPIRDNSGVLKVNESGRLVVTDGSSRVLWSSDVSGRVRAPVMQLLDSGNLVVRNASDEGFLWQSFDHPGDTMLPHMRIGVSGGLERYLSSWKSADDPSTGDYTFRFDTNGLETKTHWRSATTYRAGPWSGHQFSGRPYLNPNSAFNYTVFTVVANQMDKYFSYKFVDSSVISMVVLKPDGKMERYSWADRTSSWMVYRSAPSDMCDIYSLCGAYSSCDIANLPGCVCLDGFVPASQENWYQSDWSHGCVRQTPLHCRSDGFVKYANLKLPDTQNATVREGTTLEACRIMCSKNCYCMAFSSFNRTDGGGTRCFLWYDDIVDIKKFSQYGQDLYVRMASSVVEHENVMKAKAKARSNFNKQIAIAAGFAILEAMLLLLLGAYVYRRKKPSKGKALATVRSTKLDSKGETEEVDLPLFDLQTVADATDNFSIVNKLGEGGFGSVYKGVLIDGQEIAVKRLSKHSRQGPDEFKNEVVHIARLQHRNLVTLLGCCIDEDEKILIYEFMPNKSLDSFIFDEKLLGWPQRFQIVKGIARGLLYLHQDSRFRIIHRDLKLSNVLLDREMNPKISDFGLARSFPEDDETETRAKTRNVVGTYGYMSPEYALAGRYSTKSDVFSFGVMVLEIVSGQSNRGFSHPEHHLNLLGHAWKLYKEGRCLELASSVQKWRTESSIIPEALRVIQVGLLCVQQSPDDRPSMSAVVSMLSGEGALLLPHPKQPGFFSETHLAGLASSSSYRNHQFSLNGVSTSSLRAR